MKIAIISDIHLGDPASTIVSFNNKNKPAFGSGYDRLLEALNEVPGRLDYLILLGDILDFSIRSYYEAYTLGKAFFERLQEDKDIFEMIYVPGNHDFDLWHTVEYQTNIINKIDRMGKDGSIQNFRMSVPGIIDDRGRGKAGRFTLAGVTAKKRPHTYAGLFLDDITARKPTFFNFAYPNVYLVTDEDSIMITHGHYLEALWSVMGDLVLEAARGDVVNMQGEPLTRANLMLKEMVAINFPLCQLDSSGIGQAGPLTELARSVEHDVKSGRLETVKKYLNGLEKFINKRASSSVLVRIGSYFIKNKIIEGLKSMTNTPTDSSFVDTPEVRERFINYIYASINEIVSLNNAHSMKIPLPTKVIFGHTHHPLSWNEGALLPQTNITYYNTGGWLNDQPGGGFCGADVFVYESGKGMRSIPVRSSGPL